MVGGTPVTLLRIPLGTWRGKSKEFVVRLPGKRGLSAKQLNEWLTYMNIEPFGTIWEDIRHAQAQSLVCNLNRNSKAKPEPYTADDFRNFKERKEVVREEDPEVLSAQIRSQIFGM